MRDYKERALLNLEKDGNYFVALLQKPNPNYNPQAEGSSPVVTERVHQAILERERNALVDEFTWKVYQIVSAREKDLPLEEQQKLATDFKNMMESLKDFGRIYRMAEFLASSRCFEGDWNLTGEEPNLDKLRLDDVAAGAAKVYWERNKFRILKERPELSGKHIAVDAKGILKEGSDPNEILDWLHINHLSGYCVGSLGPLWLIQM